MTSVTPETPETLETPEPRQVRVLPIPSAHPYPQSLRSRAPGTGGRTRHLDDPPVAGARPGVWWPPPALDAGWVGAHAGEVDVVHLHFGFDAAAPADLAAWCDALERDDIPLVLTVHDLVNPHFVDQGEHRARLDVLVPRARTVITLTPAAADEIRRRWARETVVLPHPHVAPLDLVGMPPARRARPFVVGMHLKSLRANVVAGPVLDAVVAALPELPDALLRVHLHREVLDPAHPRHDAGLITHLRALHDAGQVDLVVHDPHTDDDLWAYLRSLDLSVLAYAFGTHSGWLEACHDLGTPVLAPTSGLWTQQQRCLTYDWHPDGSVDADQVAAALAEAYATRPTWQAIRPERAREQQQVAIAHERLYRAAVDGRATSGRRGDAPVSA